MHDVQAPGHADPDLQERCDRLSAEVRALTTRLEGETERASAHRRFWREQVRSLEMAEASMTTALQAAREAQGRAESQLEDVSGALDIANERLAGYRDFYEQVVTTHATWSGEDAPVSFQQMRAWLADLPALLRPPSDGEQRSQQDLLDAMATIEELRGLSEQLQELWLASGPGLRPLTPDGIGAWVARRLTGLSAAHSPSPPGFKDHRRDAELEEELLALRAHRDAVLADHLAVMASQSWRVGHVMTWPVRVFRRKDGRLEGARPEAETYP